MKYDFDKIIDRRGTGCVKWDSLSTVPSGFAAGFSPASTVPSGSAAGFSPASTVPSGSAAGTASQAVSSLPLIPLWVADMDFAVAPAIQEAIKRRAQHPVFGYTHVQDDYYEAVISWFQRRHQWHIQREWILYTTGVVPAMSVAIKALTMPGEKVLILSPDYNCFFSSIRNNGCEVAESVLRFPRDNDPQVDSRLSRFPRDNNRFSIDWPSFESLCADEKTTVFLLCNPHNPTGRVWTREELQHMADICHQHHVRIVSDEIHCELIMPGHTFVPMGTVDPDAIILNSPSKSFNIAGLQMANIICQDAETRRRLDRAININEVCDVNPFAPEAVKAAYNDSEEWIDALNLYIWDNYTVLCDFVAQHLPQWRVMPMEGTYLVWVDVSAVIVPSGFAAGSPSTVPSSSPAGSPATVRFDSVETYCSHLLQQTGVWLNPGTMYGPVSGEGYVRINIACPRPLLMEALQRIAQLTVPSDSPAGPSCTVPSGSVAGSSCTVPRDSVAGSSSTVPSDSVAGSNNH